MPLKLMYVETKLFITLILLSDIILDEF